MWSLFVSDGVVLTSRPNGSSKRDDIRAGGPRASTKTTYRETVIRQVYVCTGGAQDRQQREGALVKVIHSRKSASGWG